MWWRISCARVDHLGAVLSWNLALWIILMIRLVLKLWNLLSLLEQVQRFERISSRIIIRRCIFILVVAGDVARLDHSHLRVLLCLSLAISYFRICEHGTIGFRSLYCNQGTS